MSNLERQQRDEDNKNSPNNTEEKVLRVEKQTEVVQKLNNFHNQQQEEDSTAADREFEEAVGQIEQAENSDQNNNDAHLHFQEILNRIKFPPEYRTKDREEKFEQVKEKFEQVLQRFKSYVNSPRYEQMLRNMYWNNTPFELEERKKILNERRLISPAEKWTCWYYAYNRRRCQHEVLLGINVDGGVIAHEIEHALNTGHAYDSNIGSLWIHGLNRKEYQFLLSKNKYNNPNENLEGDFTYFDPSRINENTNLRTSSDKETPWWNQKQGEKESIDWNRNYEYGIPETVSDMLAFRYLLYEEGIFDARTEDFTNETLKKIEANEHLKENRLIKRFLERFSDENIVEVMNTIAYLPNVEGNSPSMA